MKEKNRTKSVDNFSKMSSDRQTRKKLKQRKL